MGTAREERAFAHPTIYSLLPLTLAASFLPYSLLATRFSSFASPDEGRAERRWRSDACEAPVSACHDRHADASRLSANRASPACDHCAPRADPACVSIRAHRANPALREASCVPSDGTLAFRRSTWDFWPGPVLAVVRHSLQDRAATSYAARVIVTRRSGSREPPRRSRKPPPGTPQPRSALQDRL